MSSNKPRLLDLFCGAGGCSVGYARAGFDVVGVDINPMPRYPFSFVQGDAPEYVAKPGREFDAIHASPPCQGYSNTAKLTGKTYPMLIEPVRELLQTTGKPYVIENVPGAPLKNPTMLVGSMFGLRTMRPRLFETSFDLPFVLIPPRAGRFAKMSRLARNGEYIHIAGKGGQRGVTKQWADAMCIDWMIGTELAQAIPPAYTEYIGRHLLEVLHVVSV